MQHNSVFITWNTVSLSTKMIERCLSTNPWDLEAGHELGLLSSVRWYPPSCEGHLWSGESHCGEPWLAGRRCKSDAMWITDSRGKAKAQAARVSQTRAWQPGRNCRAWARFQGREACHREYLWNEDVKILGGDFRQRLKKGNDGQVTGLAETAWK